MMCAFNLSKWGKKRERERWKGFWRQSAKHASRYVVCRLLSSQGQQARVYCHNILSAIGRHVPIRDEENYLRCSFMFQYAFANISKNNSSCSAMAVHGSALFTFWGRWLTDVFSVSWNSQAHYHVWQPLWATVQNFLRRKLQRALWKGFIPL